MRAVSDELVIRTPRRGFTQITSDIDGALRKTGIQNGVATIHVCHTSASLLIQENADPDVRRDLEAFFERLVPEPASYFQHTLEGPDDMAAHVRSTLTATNLSIPIANGRLALGVWQGVYLWEHRYAGSGRRVALAFLGE